MNRPLVLKFGGTSVGSGAAFLRAASIAAEAAQHRPVTVVVSAMAGTTDALLGLARTTAGPAREGSLAKLRRTLSERHSHAAREAVPGMLLPEVEMRLHALIGRLAEVVNSPVEDPAARRDAVGSFGERLSAEILAGAIAGSGAPAAVSPGDPIATDGRFGDARVLAGETRRRAEKYVRPLLDEGMVAVTPGYFGRGPDGAVTTLGRGGSDLSATVLGCALGAEEVWILSDVDGVLDADPRLIPEAALIPHLSYREAGQFAALGAEILHPKTTAPASEAGIKVRVASTFNPGSPGTRISDREGGPGVRSVALRRGLSLTHVPPDAAGNVFCVLGTDAEGLKVLVDGTGVAAVVCVGAPTDGDLLSGLRCLGEANIRPLFAGNTSTGLLFAVAEGKAEGALRVLHAALIPAGAPAEMEEVA
ncbi:MAG: Aspartokinase [uncultured Rubrobacteraceae bacterium]|uniref:Aspartokinase n=1 Tax=uncultured Rubrobacteraceae bacterium TaxID=349277 RepID=A0A6J4QTE9_9ACTN|nr:MAG: Aspartokinase [uncultured Rubrobacteraceae bacterium]